MTLKQLNLVFVKTSVGETDKTPIFDSIGQRQRSVGTALVSALNFGVAIKETFN